MYFVAIRLVLSDPVTYSYVHGMQSIIIAHVFALEMSYSAQFATYRQFYPKLLQVLPMDDAIFLGILYSKNLLPGDIKDKISAKQTRADKAECFLHNVIYPEFHVNETSNNQLNKLLEVMTECDNDTVRLLAAQITASRYK